MTFISYAQNYEDVMLWRALKHVEKGFYIDVGAFSPEIHSVTRAFYDRGWRGINIEPNPKYLSELKQRRTEDINLGLAVSDTNQILKLNIIEDTGLTTLQNDIAETHQAAGWRSEAIDVQAKTLSTIWKESVPSEQSVHFLKVDVEGNEAAVLRGMSWTECRPWIVVVEATFPLSQREVHDEWEDILLGANYLLAYRDGLNRFYVAKEHAELQAAFSTPPNVFDDFQLAPFIELQEKLVSDREAARREIEKVNANLSQLSREIIVLQDKLEFYRTRTMWHRLFFRASGRPKKPIRRLLFHSSGKPRGMFKKWVLHSDGRPRAAFMRWMESDEYRALPRAVAFSSTVVTEASLTERGLHFLSLLKSKNER